MGFIESDGKLANLFPTPENQRFLTVLP